MHLAEFALSQLVVDAPSSFGGLSVFPVRSAVRSSVDYLLLSDAVRKGLVRIGEVSEQGSVSDLVVENHAPHPVLIVDGEELEGAKQNRVVNLTLLIPAAQNTTIPVSCVEQGRWSEESTEFALSNRVHYARGRAEKLMSVQASMVSSDERYSDQSQIWDSIDETAIMMDAESPTAAMGSIFDRHARKLDDYAQAFQVQGDQVGGVFAIGGAICGLDVFDKPETFRAFLPKLARSYAIDALELGNAAKQVPSSTMAREFILGVGEGALAEHKAIGLGHDIRISSEGFIAGALVVDNQLLHLSAFVASCNERASRDTSEEYASFSQRRHSLQQRY